jgi:hypothetical protein
MNGCPCGIEKIFNVASNTGSRDALNWAKKIFPPEGKPVLISSMNIVSYLHVLEWIQKKEFRFRRVFPIT